MLIIYSARSINKACVGILFLAFILLYCAYTVLRSPRSCCERPQCENVLRNMLDGHWEKKAHGQQELEEINKFLHISRSHHLLPYSLQRDDKRCGNVSFDELEGRMNDLQWFRAVCDPDGDTPCCYNNQCVYLTEDECRCDGCYDMRQQIHAELATWRPSDLQCQMAMFTNSADTCKALHNMTLYLIGDSLIRHVYIALLGLLRAHKPYGPLRPYTAPGLVEMCDRNFVHLQMCMSYIDRDTWECDHQLKLKFLEYVKADQWELTLKAIDELRGKINSWVLIGIGIHDNFDTPHIVNKLLVPLLKQASQSTWPRIIWSATHAPGLLKTPRVKSQSTESILKYNEKIHSILDVVGIPVFDTFRLTNGTVSFDGIHYGRGVNLAKAQIFLNYLLSQKYKESEK